MRWLALVFILLCACAQAPEPEPVMAPVSHVVSQECIGHNVVGEPCATICDCARPLTCLNSTCLQQGLPLDDLCTQNKQCLSGYCTESGKCGGPDGPNRSYSCHRECKDDFTGKLLPCHTVCREFTEEVTTRANESVYPQDYVRTQ